MFAQLLISLFVCLIARLVWRRWKYDLHKIPSPPGLPVLGHTIEFSRHAGKRTSLWLRQTLQQLGQPKLMRLDVGLNTWLVVTDIEYIKSVLLSRTQPMPRYQKIGKFARPFLGNDDGTKNLATTADVTPYVKEVRRHYTRAFQSSQLRKQLPKLNALVDQMIGIIETKREQGAVEIQKLCTAFTLDSIGAVTFDVNLGGLDGSRRLREKIIEVGYVARDFLQNPIKQLQWKLLPNSEASRKTRSILNSMRDEWDVVAKEIIAKEDPPEGEMPLWYALKTMKDPETGDQLPYHVLRGEFAFTVVAGMDTTGFMISWTMAMLAAHPDIAEKLYKELADNGLCGPAAREVAFEDLGELTYLNAVVKEAFRIAHIGVFGFLREVPRDMTLLGYRVPKGCIVLLPMNRAINTKADWGDPDTVRPERWLTGEDISEKYYRTFSSGPRDCIGQKLAMLELRLLIVRLVSKYQLSMDCTFHDLLQNTVEGAAIEAKDGIHVHMCPRY